GVVPGERESLANIVPEWGGRGDTLLNPVITHYRSAGTRIGSNNRIWGWLPLNGFHNTARVNELGQLEPTPALSDDRGSWPAFWPDRIDNPDDPGWAGQWNGFFGRGIFNADLESYYVVDDYSDWEYLIDPETGLPFSEHGVFYASPSDSTIGGFGIQTQIRMFQWANVLAEDVMFIIYRITNKSETDYILQPRDTGGLWFAQVTDYGLGNEEDDDNAAFNAQQDVVFGWDADGIGTRTDGTRYNLGYTGLAFLESPARGDDLLDNDEDGITDEQRLGGAGILIEGTQSIDQYVRANYNVADFERFYGPLNQRPAMQAGSWWTGDENLDWVTFLDGNGNGVYDPGESTNDDVGLDGLGPFDIGYPGPDTGEGNGMPDPGEPNFDELDVDESDQIGLTGYDLDSRPFYESGTNLAEDTWMFDRIVNFAEPNITIGTPPDAAINSTEPFLLFTSGAISLRQQTTDFFSTAWIFGADETDFFKNRKTVQNIYNADYNFAQAPIVPTLTAVAGDGRVTLTWDTLATASFDRFAQEFDFEGFRLYKGTDPLLSDARVISNKDGIPTFYRPIAQWDLDNGIRGPVTVFEGEAIYDLGTDSGLSFFYVDDDVVNGITYYYALVAYDRGIENPNEPGKLEIDPQENVFNVSTNLAGQVTGISRNAAVVTPRSNAAGLEGGGANEDLSKPSSGIGTGSIAVNPVNFDEVPERSVYQVEFFSEPDENNPAIYETTGYAVRDVANDRELISPTGLVDVSPMIDGFVIEFQNEFIEPGQVRYNFDQTGFKGSGNNAGDVFSLDPRTLEGLNTNWIATVEQDSTGLYRQSFDDFELHWVNEADSTYRPPRIGLFLRVPLPFFARNATKNVPIDYLIDDLNGNREFDFGDDIILIEGVGRQRLFRHRIRFTAPSDEAAAAPEAGTVFKVGVARPFATGDRFQFTVSQPDFNADLARSALDDIAVVPNPYVGASLYEPRSQITGRGERRIRFINLPGQATIRIFTVRGELVQVLEHDDPRGNGDLFWDLKTRDLQDIAYGVYIFHVEAPGIGEKTGKFALVK
ncbi:MAG: hypothetical protein AAF752_01880, partial [Bacteroidota bacterium]